MAAVTTERDGNRPALRSDDERWSAVTRRDRRADGLFYYGVRTTGVYCRPSCVARLPRRANVTFHSSREDAERAGFRPCKRCRPDQPPREERHAAAVAKACRRIDRADEPPNLDDLAATAGMSRFHFHRVFKSVTGLTPNAYVVARRAQRVRDELPRSETVTEAIYGAGFNSTGHFYEASPDVLGMTPAGYRAGGAGACIRFGVGQCLLGSILVAATERGVCAILLGDDPEALVRQLEDRFPHARLAGAEGDFERWMATAVGLVERPGVGRDLPLDVQGTAFQMRVWQALRGIPPGSTVSYEEIASRIGSPGAARAVARACASNTVAVAIPCHRVIRGDGGLAGYRWGVERKRALLDREAAGS